MADTGSDQGFARHRDPFTYVLLVAAIASGGVSGLTFSGTAHTNPTEIDIELAGRITNLTEQVTRVTTLVEEHQRFHERQRIPPQWFEKQVSQLEARLRELEGK